jgi:LPXTG-motif cell wall-anchored protein
LDVTPTSSPRTVLAQLVTVLAILIGGFVTALVPASPAAAVETSVLPFDQSFGDATGPSGQSLKGFREVRASAKDQNGNPILLFEQFHRSLGDPAEFNRVFKILRCNDPLCAGGDDVASAGWIPPGTQGTGEYNDYLPIDIAVRSNGNPFVLVRTWEHRWTPSWGEKRFRLEILNCGDPTCTTNTRMPLQYDGVIQKNSEGSCRPRDISGNQQFCMLPLPHHYETGKIGVGPNDVPVVVAQRSWMNQQGIYTDELVMFRCMTSRCQDIGGTIDLPAPGPPQFRRIGSSAAPSGRWDMVVNGEWVHIVYPTELNGKTGTALASCRTKAELFSRASYPNLDLIGATAGTPIQGNDCADVGPLVSAVPPESGRVVGLTFFEGMTEGRVTLTDGGAPVVVGTVDDDPTKIQIVDCQDLRCGNALNPYLPIANFTPYRVPPAGNIIDVSMLKLPTWRGDRRVESVFRDASGQLGILLYSKPDGYSTTTEGYAVIRCADLTCSDPQQTTLTTPFRSDTPDIGEVGIGADSGYHDNFRFADAWLQPDGSPQFAVTEARSSSGTGPAIDVILNSCDERSCFPEHLKVNVEQAQGQLDPAPTQPIRFKVEFAAPVIGFDSSDLLITGSAGATTGVISGGPRIYDVAVSGIPASSGLVQLDIPAGAVTGPLGLTNVHSFSTDNKVDYGSDGTGPSVTVNQRSTTPDPTAGTASFVIGMSEPVVNVSNDDVVVTGTAGATSYFIESTADPLEYYVHVNCTPSSCVDGTIVVNIPAGGFTDVGGNPNTVGVPGDNVVTYDATQPKITLARAPGQAAHTSSSPVKFRITSSEPIIPPFPDSMWVTGSAFSSAMPSVSSTAINSTTYDISVTGMDTTGTVRLNLQTYYFQDLYGNSASWPIAIVNDTVNYYNNGAPMATVTVKPGQTLPLDVTSGTPATFVVDINEPIYTTWNELAWGTYDPSIVVVNTATGGYVSGIRKINNRQFEVDVANFQRSGMVSIKVGGAPYDDPFWYRDGAGNMLLESAPSPEVAVDGRPTAVISRPNSQASPTSRTPVRFRVDFSEPVTGFDRTDVILFRASWAAPGQTVQQVSCLDSGCSVSGFSKAWEIVVSGMTGDGGIQPNFSQNAATDAQGLKNDWPTTTASVNNYPFVQYTLDATRPTVAVEKKVGQNDPTRTSPIEFTITWSEPVTGFTLDDIEIASSAGTVTPTLTGTGPEYNLRIAGMSRAGLVSATINENAAEDLAGNLSTASTSIDNDVAYDVTAPTLIIDRSAGQADPGSGPVHFDIVFNEPAKGFTASDIALSGTAGATTVTLIQGEPGERYYLAEVTGMTQAGTVEINVAAAAASDVAGNPSVAPTVIDNIVDWISRPSVTIDQATSQADPTTGSSVAFTTTFSRPVTGFNSGDVTLSGTAGATTVTVTGGPSVYTVDVTGITGTGTITASIAEGVATMDSGTETNTASTSTDNTVTVDRTAPSVTVEQKSGQADPTRTSPVEFTVTFSEAVTGFTASDVTLSGTAGATTAVVTGTGPTYNVAVSGMTGAGTVIALIGAATVTDAAGNQNSASTSADNTIVYDAVAPLVTVEQKSGQADPTRTSPVEFTVTFSEAVTGFTNADVSLSGSAGATTAVVTGAGPYNVAVSGMTGNGTIIATVPAGAAADAAGNQNTASTSADNTIVYDAVAPLVTVEQKSGQADPTRTSPVEFTVTFSEAVTGFTNADITLSGSASATTAVVTGAGPYNVAVSGMTGNGTIIATVPAGAAADAAGNQNTASTSADNTIVYDAVAPLVTVEQKSGQSDPTNISPILFTLSFSEPVTGLTNADITLSGTAGATTPVISGSGPIYTVTASGMTSNGTVIASVAAGAVTDAVGNSNLASTSLDNIVTYDATRPVPTVIPAAGQVEPVSTPPGFTVTFSEPVTGFAVSDLVIGGTAFTALQAPLATLTGSGSTYTVTLYGMSADGTVTLTVPDGAAQDAATNTSVVGTGDNSIDYHYVADETPPTVTISRTTDQPEFAQSGPVTFTITFSESVTGFDSSDIVVGGTAGATSATAALGTLGATNLQRIGGSATSEKAAPGLGTGAVFKATIPGPLATGTVTVQISAAAAYDLALTPNANLASNVAAVTIDLDAPTVEIAPDPFQPSETSTSPVIFTVTFSEPVTGFESTDVIVGGTANPTTASVTGTGKSYKLSISGMRSSGTVTADIPPGVALDASGRPNAGLSVTANFVTFTMADPTAAQPPAAQPPAAQPTMIPRPPTGALPATGTSGLRDFLLLGVVATFAGLMLLVVNRKRRTTRP